MSKCDLCGQVECTCVCVRMGGLNEYVKILPGKWYDRIPKQVFAAIAVARCSFGGDFMKEMPKELMTEWWSLYHNGIVPQKPFEKEPKLK